MISSKMRTIATQSCTGDIVRAPKSTPRTRSFSSMRPRTLDKGKSTASRTSFRSFIEKHVLPASSANGSSKELVEGERRASWRQWAGDKIRQRREARLQSFGPGMNKLVLFPGWALRRYERTDMARQEGARFSLEIFVSGFAASDLPPEMTTRTQKAFLKLARAYAGLPKFQPFSDRADDHEAAARFKSLSKSTEELLKTVDLPPLPSEITDDDLRMLEQQLDEAADSDADSNRFSSVESSATTGAFADKVRLMAPHEVARLHANLHQRLRLFWSRALPNQTVRLSVHSSFPSDAPITAREPLYVCDVKTTAEGSFAANILVPWERLSDRPDAMHVAFGDLEKHTEIFIRAELLAATDASINSELSSASQTTEEIISTPITDSPIRLISDIDDTIRHSDILGGLRSVFQNVFVREHEEVALKEMSEWYTTLWSRGVQFHYVSNGPFELLPVINEYIDKSSFPRGSISLRSFLGFSLFRSFLAKSFTQKYQNVLRVLEAFKDSQFFLVGDSGESDLEVYTQVALERPHQVLAIFIRYVNLKEYGALADPTGDIIRDDAFIRRNSEPLARTRSPLSSTNELPSGSMDFGTRGPVSDGGMNKRRPPLLSSSPTESILSSFGPKSRSLREWVSRSANSSRTSLSLNGNDDLQSVPGGYPKAGRASPTVTERRRNELQNIIFQARQVLPSHIYLRVFAQPEECIEATRILDELEGHD